MSGFDIKPHLRRNYEDGVYDFLPPLVAFTANVMQDKSEYLQKKVWMMCYANRFY